MEDGRLARPARVKRIEELNGAVRRPRDVHHSHDARRCQPDELYFPLEGGFPREEPADAAKLQHCSYALLVSFRIAQPPTVAVEHCAR